MVGYTGFDLQRAREQTPGCRNVVHFNNAGSALPSRPVIEAVNKFLTMEASIGGYEAAAREEMELRRGYEVVAKLINCRPHEIAIMESATRAWQMAFYGMAAGFHAGDRILTAKAEYASNYIAFLQIARQKGVEIVVIPNTESGELSVDALRDSIDERVKLVAVTHVPTNGGLVNPAAAIGEVTRAAGVPYLLDACQSVGQLPVDVEAIGCDFLSTTGRKWLRAPRGTGFLYVRQQQLGNMEPPLLDDHGSRWVADNDYEMLGDSRRFEPFEMSIAAKVGLVAAVDYALDWGIENIERRVSYLSEMLRESLASISGVTVRDIGARKCGIVTFSTDNRDPDDVRSALSAQAINVWVSRTKSTRLDMRDRGLEAIIRASVHYYNSEEEIARFCQILSDIVRN